MNIFNIQLLNTFAAELVEFTIRIPNDATDHVLLSCERHGFKCVQNEQSVQDPGKTVLYFELAR